jgi:hypothetical protein
MAIRKDIDLNTRIFIYALVDPRDNLVRYVGWAQDIKRRFITHMWEARHNVKNHKCNWIRLLLKNNIEPKMEKIEETTYDKRVEREQYWIRYYGRENLTNGTDGGEGALGLIVSDETKKLQSEIRKSNPNWGLWNKGKKVTDPEILDKLSKSHLGQPAWNKGKSTPYILEWLTPFKKGHVPHNKGVPASEEFKKNQSDLKSGIRVGKNKNNTSSKYVGVVYNEKDNIWISQIRYNKTNNFVGRFKEENDAGIAYDIYSLYIINYDCNLNFPELRENYISYLEQYDIEDIKQLRQVIKNYILERST